MTENWSRPFRYWVLSTLAVSFAVLAWHVRELISPVVIAALLAYVLNPAVDFLTHRTRLSRPISVTIIFLASLGALAAIPALMLPTLLIEIQTLSVDLRGTLSQAQDFLSQPVVILEWEINLEPLLPNLTQLFSESITTITENAVHLLEAITKNLIWILVILVSTYYLLRDWSRLRDWLFHLAPAAYQPDARRIYQEIREIWRGYLRGNLALMVIVGVVFTLAWVAIGVPGALILGILTGVFTIIPELGPAVAATLAVMVAFFEGSTYLPLSNIWFALLVTGIYLGLINIKGIWLRPRIFGRSVHMHDGVVFVAIMVAVLLQGILGALVIVPVLASSAVVGRYLYRRLLSLPPFPDAEPNGIDQNLADEKVHLSHPDP